jgi:TRAP-type C4-dicarboxylate transport system permease small subunit
MKPLAFLARVCAVLAGVLLVCITGLTVVSVVGRSAFGAAINGDFELAGFAAGAAIALFMPWCQLRRGNIIVDFFTGGASPRARDVMDRFGALLLALVMGLMTWRSALGGLNAWNTGSGSMMLAFPEWVVYAFMVPALGLTALIALAQAARGFDRDDRAEALNPDPGCTAS